MNAIDPKVPMIAVNQTTDGKTVATIYGGIANWPRIQTPEPILEKDGTPALDKSGKPKQKWSCSLYVPKSTPGAKELWEACVALRKADLKGVGKIAAMKDGDKELDRLVSEMGKDPEKLSGMVGMWIISASTTIPPVVHNEIYGGCVAVMVIQLASYDNETKGIKAYLQEIGRVAAGQRIGGGPRAAVLTNLAFEEDAEPAGAPAASTSAATSGDSMPWEA